MYRPRVPHVPHRARPTLKSTGKAAEWRNHIVAHMLPSLFEATETMEQRVRRNVQEVLKEEIKGGDCRRGLCDDSCPLRHTRGFTTYWHCCFCTDTQTTHCKGKGLEASST